MESVSKASGITQITSRRSFEKVDYHHHRKWPIHCTRMPHFAEDTYPREITHGMRLVEIAIEDDETDGIQQDTTSVSSQDSETSKGSPRRGPRRRKSTALTKKPENLPNVEEDNSSTNVSRRRLSSCCSIGSLAEVSGSMASIFEEHEDNAGHERKGTHPHQPRLRFSDGRTETHFAAAESGGRKVWVPKDSGSSQKTSNGNEPTSIVYQSLKCPKHPQTYSVARAFGSVSLKKFRPMEVPRVIIERNENGLINRQLIPGKYSGNAKWMLYGTRVYEYMGHAFLQHKVNPPLLSCCLCLTSPHSHRIDYFKCRDCRFTCYKLSVDEVKTACPVSATSTLEMTFAYDVEDQDADKK